MKTPLHAMPLNDACAVRWERGRAERGLCNADPFIGDPRLEAYEEVVDLATYLRLAGWEDLRAEVESLAAEMRLRIAARERRAPDAPDLPLRISVRAGCGGW